METTTVNDYWISSSAISISLNAMGNYDYAQVGIAPNASIVAYVKGIIDYDNSHKCKTWKLTGAPTAFGDSDEKYVYVAIPRSATVENQNAIVVFPSELLDIHGRNEAGEQKGSTSYYYIYLQGKISASIIGGVETAREFSLSIQTGKLMSDDALMNKSDSEWYSYSAVTGRVSFLKEILMEVGSKFVNLLADSITATEATLSELTLGDAKLDGVANSATGHDSNDKIVTPLAGKKYYLSKVEDDTAEGNLQFKGKLDVFGNFVAKADATVTDNLTVGKKAIIGGDATIGGNAEVSGNVLVEDGQIGSKNFNKGINGWRIGKDGAAEMDSLSLRKFLEVPELRYNRISVQTGVQWQTFGGGLIEDVKELDATHGVIKLKLEDGEVGTIAKFDKCMGIFHNETDPDENSDINEDDHHGNFAFKGFMTIYFLVTDFCDDEGNVVTEDEAGRKQYFKYELRSASDSTWTDAHHPMPSMSFAAYANANVASRQACIYSTTTYMNMLTGMVGWTFDGNNIALLYGDLNGFTIKSKQGSVIQLEGHGIAFGNAYMWGNIKQFERAGFLVSQQVYYMATADDPSVVLKDFDYKDHYNWGISPVTPSPSAPYVYIYWHQKFDDNTEDDTGLSLLTTEGKPAPRTLYIRSTSRPEVPTSENPVGWSIIPTSGQFNLKEKYPDEGMPGVRLNYGFAKQETEDGVEFMSLCNDKDFACSWMSITIRGKRGDTINIPYQVSSEEDYDKCVISEYLLDDGDVPEDALVIASGEVSSTLRYTLKADTAVLYLGYVKDGSDEDGSDTFTVNFGRLYSITEELNDDGRFLRWSGIVAVEGINGRDGEDGEDGDNGTSPVVLTTDLSAIIWPMKDNAVYGAEQAVIHVSMNIGDRVVSRFSALETRIVSGNMDGIRSIASDPDNGIVTITPEPNEDIDSSTNKLIGITAAVDGYTRTITISLTIVAAGQSVTGPQGIQGCVVRMCGEYDPTVPYYNDSNRTTPRTGETARYIEIVQYTDDGILNYYQRNTDKQGVSDIPPTDKTSWTEANKFSFIATDLLWAKDAWIKALTGKSVYVTDDKDGKNVVAGLQSVENKDIPMLFAGSEGNDIVNANYRVYPDGTFYAKNGKFTGITQKVRTDIDFENKNKYLVSPETDITYLNFETVGSWVRFTTNPSPIAQKDWKLYMPSVAIDEWSWIGEAEEAKSLIGNRVIIENKCTARLHLAGLFSTSETANDPSKDFYRSLDIEEDEMIILECRATFTTPKSGYKWGNLVVYWCYKRGRA